MIKEPIHQIDTVILNVYASNNSCKICEAKLIKLKEKIDKYAIIIEVFNNLLLTIDKQLDRKSVMIFKKFK